MNTQALQWFRCITTRLAIASLSLATLTGSLTVLAPANACPRSSKAPVPQTARAAQTGTIVDVAASNPSFTTLVQAVQAAGLVETLSGQGPFTVFAPTNEAFAALPAGTLEKLLKPENRDILRKILTYHVLSGTVRSTAIRPGQVTTVEGSPVTLRVRNGQIAVNNSTVTTADIQTSNGIIHVINRVLLPPDISVR